MADSFIAGEYQVVVVGAGHAGCEAALAAARLGARTALLTMSMDSVAMAPCNPSIGGPAKGVLAREIDALGGAMGYVCDATQIQIRLLNTGKGPAVQALRAQIDKKQYQQRMLQELFAQPNLEVKQAEVCELILTDGEISGVCTKTGARYLASAVVLTAGTYLRGRVIMGNCLYPSGPAGYPPSLPLSEYLQQQGVTLLRFKTGTPARVDKKSLDFSKMSEQRGDENGLHFSYRGAQPDRPNVPCWLTYTNTATHQIIKDNLHRCPLYSGLIEGIGPRYCPSIEDKIVRFAHRDSHQLFLEPEGLGTDEYYVQGMSTSLPEDVQLAFMRTIPGMEQVRIVRPAYAIEYDCLDPTQLDATLQVKAIPGLFTAGQINGSSGYEEAAAQGLWAGANAALRVQQKPPFFLSRSQAYLGVLVDDLVTKGVREPYRMFTSLAEYRLLLRNDNADERLTEYAYSLGLVKKEQLDAYLIKKEQVDAEENRLRGAAVSPNNAAVQQLLARHEAPPLQQGVRLWDLLARPAFEYDEVCALTDEKPALPQAVVEQVIIRAKYNGYIKKQAEQVVRFEKAEQQRIPAQLDYDEIQSLSNESRQKLKAIRPTSVGQASRITGVSPADIAVLLVWLAKIRRSNEHSKPNENQN